MIIGNLDPFGTGYRSSEAAVQHLLADLDLKGSFLFVELGKRLRMKPRPLQPASTKVVHRLAGLRNVRREEEVHHVFATSPVPPNPIKSSSGWALCRQTAPPAVVP